jgi:hypothetical protein
VGGCLLAAMAAGCSSGVAPVSVQSPAASTSSSGSADTSSIPAGSPSPSASPAPTQSTATQPLPASTRRNLPAGVFYLLAGRGLASLSLWQLTASGRERQLTHNRPGFGVDAFDASAGGIILADGTSNGDDLARLTPQGPLLLHKTGQLALLRGSSPDIRNDGMIGYVTPPTSPGSGTGSYFEIWTRRSFSSQGSLLLRQRHPLAGPVFGPHGQIAVEGWGGAGQRKPSVLIYSRGDVRRLLTGINAIPSLLAWGQHAPALALAFPAHAAELLFPDGHRQLLPAGWQPLTWNPDGTELLMQSARALGIWTVASPDQVTRIGAVTPGIQVLQADWLTRKAPL